MGFPLGMSAAAESGPDPAARISVVASIGYFANLAGPPTIGALAQSAGLLSALWLLVALFLAAFAAAGALRPRPVAGPPAEPQARSANVQPGDTKETGRRDALPQSAGRFSRLVWQG
jgi:hypothetical protein